VLPETTYSRDRGYGFEGGATITAVDRGGADPRLDGFCTSDRPFFFSVDLPEGNYNVTVTLGDRDGESTTTVKAESRRLMLEKVHTGRGDFARRTFSVNVRNPRLPSGGQVQLKDRERGVLHWDDRLTLEFSNTRPCLCALEIDRAEDAITVFLAGDSTVTDQPREPWAAWGQMLPRFFKAGVAVANHAESGEALRSFLGARRLDKIFSQVRPGDYVFIQFGHNDQKDRRPGAGAFTTYQELLERYVKEARLHGALPVLMTSMHRRTFNAEGTITNSLGDFPEAVRRVARAQDVPLIDLNAMSKPFYEALGPEASKRAFVHYPAGSLPGQQADLKDDTHFNAYGAYELARCVVEGIRASKLDLARHLADDVPPFDPAHPDPIASWSLPASPAGTLTAPEGR
jgi:lysophospholipase L1-like esterase